MWYSVAATHSPSGESSNINTMKIAALLLFLVATAVPNNVGAIFTPRSRAPAVVTKTSFSYSHVTRSPTVFEKALTVAGGAKDKTDSDSGVLQNLIDSDIFVIDTDVAATEVAENWGLVVLSGVASFAVGCLALCNPFEATDVAFLGTMATLCVAGVINTGGCFFAESGYKLLTLITGVAQLALSGLMYVDPLDSEVGLSLGVTISVFCDGLYRTVLALQNPGMSGRFLTCLGGIVSMVTSVYVTKYMPLTFVAAPGIAMGVSLVSTGIVRVAIGFAGRDLAKDSK